jgi:hypothetical protein
LPGAPPAMRASAALPTVTDHDEPLCRRNSRESFAVPASWRVPCCQIYIVPSRLGSDGVLSIMVAARVRGPRRWPGGLGVRRGHKRFVLEARSGRSQWRRAATCPAESVNRGVLATARRRSDRMLFSSSYQGAWWSLCTAASAKLPDRQLSGGRDACFISPRYTFAHLAGLRSKSDTSVSTSRSHIRPGLRFRR